MADKDIALKDEDGNLVAVLDSRVCQAESQGIAAKCDGVDMLEWKVDFLLREVSRLQQELKACKDVEGGC